MPTALSALAALRRDPRLLKLPPYISALLVLVGVLWLLLLPLNQYSRHTYISENALLPGQVHTYFGGSEQNVFDAYRHEIRAVIGNDSNTKSARLREIFHSTDLKPVSQHYQYHAAGKTFKGENIYGILRAPRGDATEAVVLAAAWENMDEKVNINGMGLVLTLARYFSRWSLWSKDIIFLITPDSRAGPQAWVDAYHDEHNSKLIDPLPVKSGALQGAIVVDNPLDHNWEKIHIVYDGINGQLPNLDLINTVVTIASGQMGIGMALQRMFKHDDSYYERLQTMLRGMLNQGAGQSHGAHSSFIPYHIDAITLQAVGDGIWDDMTLGRVVESIFRSLNNLLEHFHQSFFFYILMQTDRFVSIGTYLPSAMLVAANFSITAIALWVRSGRAKTPKLAEVKDKDEVEVIERDGMKAIAPKQPAVLERHLFLPLWFVATAHFLGLFPLYIFNVNQVNRWYLGPPWLSTLVMFANLNFFIPNTLGHWVKQNAGDQQKTLTQCISLLLLGMFLATLATLNFSLSLFIGLLATPLSFVDLAQASETVDVGINRRRRLIATAVLQLLSPPVVLLLISLVLKSNVLDLLADAAFGWAVNGIWTQIVVWCIWWPAWFVGSVLVWPV